MAFRAPVLGYNTNVRHKGRLFHIQTEDSGVGHPHVITHLFADGGRIVASKKTAYAEHIGADNLPDFVKKLMQAQHKQMFIALRDGQFDEDAQDPAQKRPPGEAKVSLYRSAPSAQPSSAAAHDATSGEAKASDAKPSKSTPSLFERDGSGLGLDEVILRYLAQEDRDAS
jgi:hypothetical protein